MNRLIIFQKHIKMHKKIKTFAPIGAPVIRCKCYRVQLVRGPTGFHQCPWNFSKFELLMYFQLYKAANFYKIPQEILLTLLRFTGRREKITL